MNQRQARLEADRSLDVVQNTHLHRHNGGRPVGIDARQRVTSALYFERLIWNGVWGVTTLVHLRTLFAVLDELYQAVIELAEWIAVGGIARRLLRSRSSIGAR